MKRKEKALLRTSLLIFLPVLGNISAFAAGDPADCAARFARLKEIQYNTSEFESEILRTVRKPAVDGLALKEKMAEVWKSPSLSVREKTQITFERYFEERLAEMPADRQALARKALAEMKHGAIRGAYNHNTGALEIGKSIKDHDILAQAVLVHELEHLDQFGLPAKNVAGRFPPDWEQQFSSRVERLLETAWIAYPESMKRRMATYEPEAIGAAWDLLHAIPAEARKAAAERFLSGVSWFRFIERRERQRLANDLLLADLSREEYIRRVVADSGYTLGSPLMQQTRVWMNHVARAVFLAAFADAVCMAMPGCTPVGPPPPWKQMK